MSDPATPKDGDLDILEGLIDLHVHSAPDVISRRYTDYQITSRAKQFGLDGVLLKCHHESTVGRAQAVSEALEGVNVFGGQVLNDMYSGGMHGEAVDCALSLGARIIWLPTVTSKAHRTCFEGETGDDVYSPKVLREICQAVSEHDACLATGHASRSTVYQVAAIAAETHTRLLITHADFLLPDLSLQDQASLAQKYPNVIFERCAYTCALGSPQRRSVALTFQGIMETGVERNLLSSDLGQPDLPDWPQGFAYFLLDLLEEGLREEDARYMAREQALNLLGEE
jgi:hypothetical protein